jgi:hypothetical protein
MFVYTVTMTTQDTNTYCQHNDWLVPRWSVLIWTAGQGIQPLDYIVDPLNSVHNLKSYLCKWHFNTTLLSMSGSYLQVHLDNDILPSMTQNQNYRKEEKK